jgi:hypothetical protein
MLCRPSHAIPSHHIPSHAIHLHQLIQYSGLWTGYNLDHLIISRTVNIFSTAAYAQAMIEV